MGYPINRCWSTPGAAPIRSAAIFFAALLALVALIRGTSRDALASAGCGAVNTGGFNVSASGFGNKAVVGFAVGDKITFTIAWSSSGSWLLRTANFTNLDDSPIVATSGSRTRSYTVTGENDDTTLTQFTYDGTTVTASCTAAAPRVTSISPTRGPATGGASVTITGTGFTDVASVNFGSHPAPYTSNSDSSITGTLPAGSGTVDVIVTTSGGSSTTSVADQFTYITTPDALLITVLPRADPRRRSPRSRPTSAPPTASRSPGPTSPALRR
jgi:IPT/TIG domain-containing protein